MAADCAANIQKAIIDFQNSNEDSNCDPPPPFLPVEICKSLMAQRKIKAMQEAKMNAFRKKEEEIMRERAEIEKIKEEQAQNRWGFLNAMMQKIARNAGCNDACQRRRKIDELRAKWVLAADAEKAAPEVTESAEKAYYVYSEGESGWHEVLMKRYTAEAVKNKEQAIAKHKELMKELHTLIDDYEGETLALKKKLEHFEIRLDENKALKAAIDSEVATVQTNDRKVVYENWAQDWLGTIKSLLITIYIILSIVYLVWGPFLENSEYKTIKGWIQPVVLIILPFTIYYIVQFIYFLKSKIAWWIDNKSPKDVFLDLNNST